MASFTPLTSPTGSLFMCGLLLLEPSGQPAPRKKEMQRLGGVSAYPDYPDGWEGKPAAPGGTSGRRLWSQVMGLIFT